jgi:hypothetical protein
LFTASPWQSAVALSAMAGQAQMKYCFLNDSLAIQDILNFEKHNKNSNYFKNLIPVFQRVYDQLGKSLIGVTIRPQAFQGFKTLLTEGLN